MYVQIFRIIFCLIDCLPEGIYLFNSKNVVSINASNRKYMYAADSCAAPSLLTLLLIYFFFFAGSECLDFNPFLIWFSFLVSVYMEWTSFRRLKCFIQNLRQVVIHINIVICRLICKSYTDLWYVQPCLELFCCACLHAQS